MPHDVREATHERLAVERLELVHPAPVYDAGDDLPYVVALAGVFRDEAVDLLRVVQGLLGLREGPRGALLRVQVRDYLPHDRGRVLVILGQMVRHTRGAGVDVAAS